jgi:secreted trypsin-like serine protease
LIQINQTLDLNGEHKHLTPICLPNDTKIDLVSADCVITGWGYPKADGNATIILQEAVVPIVNSSVCFEIFGFRIDIKTCICAGDLKAGGLGTCHGDSGGPLQCKMSNDQWYQFGIVSWGKACANPGIPDIYTKVVAYNEWIEEVIGSNY